MVNAASEQLALAVRPQYPGQESRPGDDGSDVDDDDDDDDDDEEAAATRKETETQYPKRYIAHL